MCATRSPGKGQAIAALVVLKHGPTAAEAAVAANIEKLRPPEAEIDEARRALTELGFQVSECVGNSFSIEAPVSHFERVFHAKLAVHPDGGVTVRGPKGGRSLELSLASLPKSVQRLVRAVSFSEPPAFGPGGTGP